MHIENNGSVYFDLKNSVITSSTGTIYDDVVDIDSVTVKQAEKNKVRIYVQGKNVSNTEIVFVNSLFEDVTKPKKININKPISEYQSTDYKDDLEDDIQEWNDNSFNPTHLGISIFSNLKEGPLGMIFLFLALIGVIIFIGKILTSKISQDSEPLIGLQSNYTKDDDLIRSLNRAQALRDAKAEITKAHEKYNNYIKEKQKNNQINNTETIKRSIALNQYQKSTTNPYKNQEVIKINKDFTTKDGFTIPPRPKTPSPSKADKNQFVSPYIQRTKNKIDYLPQKENKSSNMKFLESVTKIYEQSGREDLAEGLKNSIYKATQVK